MFKRLRLPLLLFTLCLSSVLWLASPGMSTQSPKSDSQNAPTLSLTENVQKTVLDNGLTVLTKEVHTAPVVSVQVWYKVGSRNEAPGVNGIAHQLEHMLFKGTTTRPIQFGRLFSALGSESNAFTSYDNTAYFGTVERDKLTALLALEADRMQNSRIDPQQLESEKHVVISELQGYENSPGYRLNRAVMRAAFPTSAYGLPVGGTKADVEKFTHDQVLNYYRQNYSPNNATLVVVGDFQTEATLKAVNETFGKISRVDRPKSPIPNPQPSISNANPSKTPLILREEGSSAMFKAIYPLPSVNQPDVPALDVMDYVLTGGRNSRLYQAVVETGLASSMYGYAANLVAGGWYDLFAAAAPGQELGKIDQVLSSEITALQDKGISEEELNRAKRQLSASAILDSRDINSQATQLGYNQSSAGDYRYIDRYLAAVETVKAADVQRVAKRYLAANNRTVAYFMPTVVDGQSGGSSGGTQTSENFNLGSPVDPAEVAKYLPTVGLATTPNQQSLPQRFTLENGMKVLLLPDSSTPTITLSGQIRAGTEFDSAAKAGLASLTAENITNGTKTQDALTLAKRLEDRGASLGFAAYREGVSVGGYSLAADLPILIQSFADEVQNATFPADKLELSRQQFLSGLEVELDSPSDVARRTFQQTVYPENHPFHAFPTEKSLSAIARADLVRFYQDHYRPDVTTLAIVGDFDPLQVRSLLETALASWKALGKPPTPSYPSVSLPEKVVQLNPVLKGKAQSVTYLGFPAIQRQDPRFYAALVLNQILGGDTLSSRLGTEIRDRQGLTYGIYSYFQTGINAGSFQIQMQTAPEDTQKAIASTRSLLAEIQQKGVTLPEVVSAQRSITSRYPVSLAEPDSVASAILSNEIYGLEPEEIRNYVNRIQSVTLEQVNQAAKELLHPDNLVVVTAGP